MWYHKLGVLDYCVFRYERSRVRHRHTDHILPWDFVVLEIWKNKPRIFRTTLTKRAFLLVGDFTQKAFSVSLDPHLWIHHPNNWLKYVSGLDRALRLGQLSRHDDRRDPRQASFKFKNLKFYLFFLSRSQNGGTTSRSEVIILWSIFGEGRIKSLPQTRSPIHHHWLWLSAGSHLPEAGRTAGFGTLVREVVE